MYELLNKIDTDICEYEKEPLTEEEEKQVEKRVQEAIRKRKGINWKKNFDNLFRFGECKQVVF